MSQSIRLIQKFRRNAITSDDVPLADLLHALAMNIEEAMLEAGATPGSDYKMLDIFQMAMPFALERWSTDGSNVSIEL